MQKFIPEDAAAKAASADKLPSAKGGDPCAGIVPRDSEYRESCVGLNPHKSAVFHEECGKTGYQTAYAYITAHMVELAGPFARNLDPEAGTGFAKLDLTSVLPPFLHRQALGKFTWPTKETWAFGGDPRFPHHVSLMKTPPLLRQVIGPDYFTELVAFGEAVTDSFNAMLPLAERDRMVRQDRKLALDFAEIRVEDGTGITPGGRVHIDWERGEAMVLVIPLEGNHPMIFPEKIDAEREWTEGHVVGYLLTGKARWETFHTPSDSERARWVTLQEYEDLVAVPEGMVRYRDERAVHAYEDMHPEYPGVMPTVHRGGTGPRKVLILNFSHTEG